MTSTKLKKLAVLGALALPATQLQASEFVGKCWGSCVRNYNYYSGNDLATVEKIRSFLDSHRSMTEMYLKLAFQDNHLVMEPDAGNNRYIRMMMNATDISGKARELAESLSYDQQRVAFAYLNALEKQDDVARFKSGPEYFDVVIGYAREFKAKTQKEEELAKSLLDTDFDNIGLESRPLSGQKHIDTRNPKFRWHPINALVLSEFREILYPERQQATIRHFQAITKKSRNTLISNMKRGEKTTGTFIYEDGDTSSVDDELYYTTTYKEPVFIEFDLSSNVRSTDAVNNNQRKHRFLKTGGHVTLMEDKINGNKVYVIEYKNHKDSDELEPEPEYLVSEIIPIGQPKEEILQSKISSKREALMIAGQHLKDLGSQNLY